MNVFVNQPLGWGGGFGRGLGLGWGWGGGLGLGLGGWGGGLGLGLGGWGLGWGPDWGLGWGLGPQWGLGWGGGWGGGLGWGTGLGWGAGWDYVNPYWQEPLVVGTTVIDYSQPIIVLNETGPAAEPVPDDDPTVSAAMVQFDAARAAFGRGDYHAALQGAHRALEHMPGDAALHEFVALVHFAQGNYREAAGTIHAVLAAGPGWNWETMSSLYPEVAVYTQQLRAAEAYRRANPESAYVRFLLAYHYMTTGHPEPAANQLRQVLALEPEDPVAAQLLSALTGEEITPPAAAREADGAVPPLPPLPPEGAGPVEAPALPGTEGQGPAPEALVGTWRATREGAEFGLTLDETGRFTWSFRHGDETGELTGTYTLEEDVLVLESQTEGAMGARVSQIGENRFRFLPAGAPEDDPGLTFESAPTTP